MQSFKINKMFDDYLEIYLLHIFQPGVFQHPVVQKLYNFHAEREREEYIREALPEYSQQYRLKQMLSVMGRFKDQPDKNAEQQQEDIEA